jgi:hypothetical protein
MTRTIRMVISIGLIVGLCSEAYANPVTLTIIGQQLNVAGEFVDAVPVPIADQEFAPLFAGGRSITATVMYDTNQLDVDPDPNTGTYRIGALSVVIPELGLTATRTSSAMQISVFNDAFNVSDQFFVAVNGVDAFSSNVGLPVPYPDTSFNILLTGPTSMLPNALLPTGPFAWTFGNLTFNFLGSDGSVRQVLLTFVPGAAPTPLERMQSLIASINGLVANGTLKAGQGNGLIQPLRNALRSLATGHLPSACSQLSDFEAGVTEKILDGALSAQDGQALIDAAEGIRRDLGC